MGTQRRRFLSGELATHEDRWKRWNACTSDWRTAGEYLDLLQHCSILQLQVPSKKEFGVGFEGPNTCGGGMTGSLGVK